MSHLCRDCLSAEPATPARCAQCGSPRLIDHPELAALAIAHIDCDAFYANIEKRDDPALRSSELRDLARRRSEHAVLG